MSKKIIYYILFTPNSVQKNILFFLKKTLDNALIMCYNTDTEKKETRYKTMARHSNKKVWKEYRFEDGYSIFCRGMSNTEKAYAVREHGKLLAIIDTNEPW